jgi:hypothetical protein
VSVKHKLRKVLLIGSLGVGSLLGVPMTAEEIEELLYLFNQPRIEVVVKEENDEGNSKYPLLPSGQD